MSNPNWNHPPQGPTPAAPGATPTPDAAASGVRTRPLPQAVQQAAAQQAAGPYGYAPQASAPQAYAQPSYTEPPMTRGSNRLVFVAALLGALVLVGGAAWFALQAFTATDGAASPEEATDQLVEALNAEDFVALAELMEPGERRAIAEPLLFDVVPELQRLGVLGEAFDPSAIAGFEVDLSDVSYRVDRPEGSPDVAHVHFTSGTSTVTMNPDEMALGDDLSGFLDAETSDADLVSETPLVMVERDGRWYFSLTYTFAEAVWPGQMPALAAAMSPVGAATPEQAVETMITDLVALDLRAAVAGMEPGEMGAVQRWSSLFIDDAQAMIDESLEALAADDISWTISDLQLERHDDGDQTLVAVQGFVFRLDLGDMFVELTYGPELIDVRIDGSNDLFSATGQLTITPNLMRINGELDGQTADVELTYTAEQWTISGQVDGEPIDGSLVIDDDCSPYSFTGLGESESGCLADLVPNQSVDQLFEGSTVGEPFPAFDMVVVETDGAWHVSPLGTVMRAVVAQLEALEPSDLDTIVDDLTVGTELFDEALGVGLGSSGSSSGLVLAEPAPVGGGATGGSIDVSDSGSLDQVIPMSSVVGNATTFVLEPGATEFAGTLTSGTHDLYAFTSEGGTLTVELEQLRDSLLDPRVMVVTADGEVLGENDDDPSGSLATYASRLVITVPAGEVHIRAGAFADASGGDYVLRVSLG